MEAYNDPELLSHRKYAALFDTRVRQLMERLYTGESGGMWATLQSHWAAFEAAGAASQKAAEESRQFHTAASAAATDSERDAALRKAALADEQRSAAVEQSKVCLQNIGKTIAKGVKDEASWRELLDTAHEASLMKSRETKRLESERMMVPVTEVMTLVSVLYGYCREASESLLPPDTSRTLLSRVGEGVQRLLHHAGNANRDLQRLTAPGDSAGGGGEKIQVIDAESSEAGGD